MSDEERLDNIDIGTWRETVVYRLAVLDERTKHLRNDLNSMKSSVRANHEFKEHQEHVEKYRNVEKSEKRARLAVVVAVLSLIATVLIPIITPLIGA